MSDTVSTLAQKLRPFWLRDLGATTPASTGGSGMIAHALSGPYHTGTLDPSQAPWAVNNSLTLTAGNGLTGGGDLSADRSFALTTPGTVTVSSTNNAAGSHTHAVTSSTDVGTTPAASILASTAGGALTLAGLTVKGNVTLSNNGDLTVVGSGSYAGSNVLFADSSGGNVGIMMAPDPQFALDVAGPARATYFVGPHALQVKDAIMICHYDGRQPFNTNFSGEPNGHFGQVATVAGGVIYCAGKFGKAVQVATGTTNLFSDPSCEYDATMSPWTKFTSAGTFTGTRSTEVVPLYGTYVGKLVCSASATGILYQAITPAAGTCVVTFYVRKADKSAVTSSDCNVYIGADKTTTFTSVGDGWYRALGTATATGSAMQIGLRIAANKTLYIDGLMCEPSRSVQGPYCDGSLGDNHTWSGTVHASSSTRVSASLAYNLPAIDYAAPVTIMAWVNLDTTIAANYQYLWYAHTDAYSAYRNSGGTLVVGGVSCGTLPAGWVHVALVTDGAAGVTAYVNGVSAGTGSITRTSLTTFNVGGQSGGNRSEGLIDDFAIIGRALPASEIRSIYESNAPIFAETSVFSFRPTPKGLIWADDEGLWMRATDGDTVLGVYGNDAATKLWGGQTMSAGDLLIGNATNYLFWDDSAATLTIAGNGSGMTSINGGNITTGSITGNKLSLTTTIGINSTTFGASGIQLDYNAGTPRFYAGNGSSSFLQYNGTNVSMTGFITATGGSFTGGVYCGSNAVRFSTDGQRHVLPNLGAPNLKTTIPSNSSAIRWFAGIDDTWTNAANYTGMIGYRDTTNHVVDFVQMSYVGSTDYSTYYARSMLYANRYNGSTDKECRLEATVDPGAGGAYVTATCDTMYTSNNLYVTNNMSALSITDRTPHFEGDALAALRPIRGKTRILKGKQVKEIDHSTLPAFARVRLEKGADKQPEEGRDLGAMISILTVAVQQLDARLDALEGRGNGSRQ